jgi:hypothetical protein
MTRREIEEFRALRSTIRERGTARVWLFVIGLIAWAALTIATATVSGVPVMTSVPLVVLLGTFEGVLALHLGAERIGRYLQVFHESGGESERAVGKWEHTVMAFGRGVPGGATDPLFVVVFAIATLLNFVPVLLAQPTAIEVNVIGGAHFLVLGRFAIAKRAAGKQRAFELDRFTALRDAR